MSRQSLTASAPLCYTFLRFQEDARVSSRKEEMHDRFRSYQDSYNEHCKKIVNGFQNGQDVYTIRGWIGDCRHFAEKTYEYTIKFIEQGGTVQKIKGDKTLISNCAEADIRHLYEQRLEEVNKLEQKNESR
jgi:hypothetical protein